MKINYEQCYEGGTKWTTRAHAWAMSSELTDNGDGTYSIIDTEIADSFGTGSEIIVIDIPGKLLFWDAETQLAYDWTGSGGGGGGGGGDIPAGYVVVAPEQEVTFDGSSEGVELSVAQGVIVPYHTPVDWYVKVDGKQLEYQNNSYMIDESGVTTFVGADGGNSVILGVYDMSEMTPIPGTHTVEIYGPDYSDTVPTGYTSVAPKQGVTVGNELLGVIIPSENYTLPSVIPDRCEVSVNGKMLEYDTETYLYFYEDANVTYAVQIAPIGGVNRLMLIVDPTPSEPVTYTVYIYSAGDR